MLNWGDKDSAERLAAQLKELLRDRTMTYDQLASCYSIKHGQSVNQRLKEMSRDGKPMLLGDFIKLMTEYFEVAGKNQVKAKGPSSAPAPASAEPAVSKSAGYPQPVLADPGIPASPLVGQSTNQEQPVAGAPTLTMRYSDVSRNIQSILKEASNFIPVQKLDEMFLARYSTSISDVVGMTTAEYLQRKENIFDYNLDAGTVGLQVSLLAGPPVADPNQTKDESFVVKEFAQLIEALGPVVYISTLCGKFIQRNGTSVTSVISTRPLDLFKRHPQTFLIVGAGNVTLKKYEHLPEVQRLVDKPSSKASRMTKAAVEAMMPVPDVVTEEHVVEEFRRLILSDGVDSVYISSLCGRFLQRFKKPVTAIIDCKPADFLRRYPEIFVMTGGGNVGLRDVLGPDAVSVPFPPARMPKPAQEDAADATLLQAPLSHKDFRDLGEHLFAAADDQAAKQMLQSVCRHIEQASFLALEQIVIGGPSGKGLHATSQDAELVLFVRQLPFKNFSRWLPHILETLAPVMEYQLAAQLAEGFKVEKDCLSFTLQGDSQQLRVIVYLSPVFRSRQDLLECIQDSPPGERFYFYPALVKDRNDFLASQSQDTKDFIDLMSWWVSRHRWAGDLSRPSQWLIESLVVHTMLQLGDKQSGDMAETVDRIFEVFADLRSIKVLWEDTGHCLYAPDDIWKPLLSHEPLVMDPVNPYCNLADVNSFDAQSLANHAQAGQCLNVFKRELAHLKYLREEDGEDVEGNNE